MNNKKCTEWLYENKKRWDKETRDWVWKKWIWNTNCNALPLEECWDMNEMHIYGLLFVIQENLVNQNYKHLTTEDIFNPEKYEELKILHLTGSKTFNEFSLRELLDLIECLQLNWGKVIGVLLDHETTNLAEVILGCCCARLGDIATHCFQIEGTVLDDVQFTSALPRALNAKLLKNCKENPGKEYGVISRKAMRQGICILHSLYRVFYIIQKCKHIPKMPDLYHERILQALKIHHIESSIDFFNVFQQMVYLAPGMRLVYRTNFAGMYNDVSQVIYFHYPKFSRQPQLSLKDIPYSNIHLLALLTQLIPDISIFYDDDTNIPGLCEDEKNEKSTTNMQKANGTSLQPLISLQRDREKNKNDKQEEVQWAWLVSCGEIFLLKLTSVNSSTGASVEYTIYISEDHSLLNLVAFFLKETGRKLGDELLDSNTILTQKQSINLTPHGHIQVDT
jgi:hypothetical protein